MDSVPNFAAVNETVDLARNRGERSFINGVLRAAVRLGDALPMPDEKKNYRRYMSVKYSFPIELVKHFDSLVGRDRCEKILSYYNERHGTDIFINSLKISPKEYKLRLSEERVAFTENEVCEASVRIEGSVSPERFLGFSEGYFLVQDRSSTMSAVVLGLKAGESMIDTCAAPGGKSIVSAIMSGDSARIHALDIHENKLSLIDSSLARLGIASVDCRANDAEQPMEEYIGKIDKVLCDVPCSGLGVLSKKPDLRYKDMSTLDTLPSLQYSILSASAKYLKTGGTLVYSTCTLNPKENEEVVGRFISENSEYSLVDFEVEKHKSCNGMFTLYPDLHNSDGFFIAKIVRNK
jgi:16S rRNA (cytosine967-C5)-methyltransferase